MKAPLHKCVLFCLLLHAFCAPGVLAEGVLVLSEGTGEITSSTFTTVPVDSRSPTSAQVLDETSRTTDASATSIVEDANVSEVPVTLTATSNDFGMETSWNTAKETISSQTSSETNWTTSVSTPDQVTMETVTDASDLVASSASSGKYTSILVATFSQVTMEMVTTPMHDPVASPESDYANPVTTSSEVKVEMVSDPTHTLTVSSTSSEKDSTTIVSTSTQEQMEVITTPAQTHPASPRSDLTNPVTTSSEVKLELVSDPTHTQTVSPTSSEDDSTTVVSTSAQVSMETTTTPAQTQTASPGNDPTNLMITSSEVTMEMVSDLTHTPTASPRSDSTNVVATSTKVNLGLLSDLTHTQTAFATSSEEDSTTIVSISVHVTTENITTPAQTQTASPGGDPTNFMTTSSEVTMEMISDLTHTPTASTTSSEEDSYTIVPTSTDVTIQPVQTPAQTQTVSSGTDSSLLTTSSEVTMEVDYTHTSAAWTTFSEKESKTAVPASTEVAMEMITTPAQTHTVSSGSDFTDLVTTSSKITTEMISDRTRTPTASLISSKLDTTNLVTSSGQIPVVVHNQTAQTTSSIFPETYSTSHVTPLDQVITEITTNPTYYPTVSQTSSETEQTASVTKTDYFTEMVSTTSHNPMASTTFPGNVSEISLSTSDHVTTEAIDPTSEPAGFSTSSKRYSTSTATSDHTTTVSYRPMTSTTTPEYVSDSPGSTSDHVTKENSITATSSPLHSSTYVGNDFTTADFITSGAPPQNSTNQMTTSAHTTMDTVTTSDIKTTSSNSLLTKDLSTLSSTTAELGTPPSTSSTILMPTTTSADVRSSNGAPTRNYTTSSERHSTLRASENTSSGTSSVTTDVGTVQASGTPESMTASDTGTKLTLTTSPSSAVPTKSQEGSTQGMTIGKSISTAPAISSTTVWWPDSSTTPPKQISTSAPAMPGTTLTTNPGITEVPIKPARFCSSNPCPFSSICVELDVNFTCRCLPGFFYSGGRCERARVFPGDLHVTRLAFEPEMSNWTSRVFRDTAKRISDALREALKDQPGYVKSTVLELREGSVVASVDNVFALGSNATEQSTVAAIGAAIRNCNGTCGLLAAARFEATDLCRQQPGPCDIKTADCTSARNGTVACTCREGYVPSFYSSSTCTACPSGERAEGGSCVPCPFGYAGFNCDDSSLLALVVTSCILGPLLLVLLLAFAVYCRRWERKRGPPRKATYNSPLSGDELQATWSTQEFTHIPRATTNWEPAHMEMVENSHLASELGKKWHSNGSMGPYEVKPEDMRTFKGKNTTRYSYLIQGHENPYFLAEERRNK